MGAKIVAICDTCHEETEILEHLQESVDELKARGWGIRLGRGHRWIHTCPACLEKKQ